MGQSNSTIPQRFLHPHGARVPSQVLKRLQKKVLRGKITPFFPPGVVPRDGITMTCGVCFQKYAAVNQTDCCDKDICSTCYAVLRVQHGKDSVICPWCRHKPMRAHFRRRPSSPPAESTLSHSTMDDTEAAGIGTEAMAPIYRPSEEEVPAHEPESQFQLPESSNPQPVLTYHPPEEIEDQFREEQQNLVGDIVTTLQSLSPSITPQERDIIMQALFRSITDM